MLSPDIADEINSQQNLSSIFTSEESFCCALNIHKSSELRASHPQIYLSKYQMAFANNIQQRQSVFGQQQQIIKYDNDDRRHNDKRAREKAKKLCICTI